jgi:hypothetical protein
MEPGLLLSVLTTFCAGRDHKKRDSPSSDEILTKNKGQCNVIDFIDYE